MFQNVKCCKHAITNSGNGNGNNNNELTKDDDYYLAIGSESPRFVYYRHVRTEIAVYALTLSKGKSILFIDSGQVLDEHDRNMSSISAGSKYRCVCCFLPPLRKLLSFSMTHSVN
jgi:hypothetical protein